MKGLKKKEREVEVEEKVKEGKEERRGEEDERKVGGGELW